MLNWILNRHITILSGLLGFALSASVLAQSDDELLPAEEAFAFSSEIVGTELVASWEIADGYYMYQDKFAAAALSGDVLVGELVLPAGKLKDDPLFGEVVTYTKSVELRVPLSASAPSGDAILEIWGQGCNEPVGVCYPPIKNEVAFGLSLISQAAASTSSTSAVSQNSEDSQGAQSASDAARIDKLSSLFDQLPTVTEENLLDVDDAFVVSVWAQSSDELIASFEVAQGYYLYQDKIEFQAQGPVLLQQPIFPPPKSLDDPFFGESLIYPENFDVTIAFLRESPQADSLTLSVQYQGCAKDFICYPPVTKSFNIPLPALAALDDSQSPQDAGEATSSAVDLDASWIWLVLTAFGTGVLLTFTPCVLPLIPILSSIIAGESSKTGSVRGGMLSIIYVLGTVVTYASVGAVAGATGDQLQAYFQNAWAIGAMSLVFVLMALSLFGFYEIRMPSSFETKMQQSTMRITGGKAGAVFVLGAFSALVVSACVSPLLISVLSIAIAKADPVLGAVMMTATALGMGVILVAIGFGLAVTLPKAGAWMDRLKQCFGVMLLAVAVYLLGNIPAVPVLLLWAVLFIVSGVYLGATHDLPSDAGGWKLFCKGIGLVLLVWGILSLLGAVLGNRDVLQPLPQLSSQDYAMDELELPVPENSVTVESGRS